MRVPRRGEIHWFSVPANHTLGHEQHAEPCRPFIVLSVPKLGAADGLIVGVPITSQKPGKGPKSWWVPVSPEDDVRTAPGDAHLEKAGWAMPEHIRSISFKDRRYNKRHTSRAGKAKEELISRIERELSELLGLP